MRKSEIKKEIEKLLDDWATLSADLLSDEKGPDKGFIHFVSTYDLWYSKAVNIVKNILPDRTDDFIHLYKNDKRKSIQAATYTVSDALKGVSHGMTTPKTAISNLFQQCAILKACLEKFDSKVYDIQNILQADLFDSELDSARYLLKNGFLRASGAICGVILEKHLSKVCADHNLKTTKKDPTLAVYNEMFKDNVYETLEWRRMQRLADLRNLCDHDKKKEPTKEEVEELITGTDRVIKTIF